MVASANGTFSSPVGKSAFRRVELLRKALFECEALFPENTSFFQLNDLVIACLDLEIDVSSMTIDPESISIGPIPNDEAKKLLKFLSASASLHQKSLNFENTEQLGQGPRSFVVLGRRWLISEKPPGSKITENAELQANMALAEAYEADTLGSSAGFIGSPWDRLFVNDFIWHSLVGISCPLAQHLSAFPINLLNSLNSLGLRDGLFPYNLVRNTEIAMRIFHRNRKFIPFMSHHTCEIQSRMDSYGRTNS